MNLALMGLEIGVLVLALGVLLMDLWMPADRKRLLGYLAAAGVGLMLAYSFVKPPPTTQIEVTSASGTNAVATLQVSSPNSTDTNALAKVPVAMKVTTPNINGSYVMDGLAVFFKRFFLLSALIVLLMSAEFSSHVS